MLLKRLELQGFKSFADKTVLEFGEGVTAVVGPNGSGKSNISDAIRWVMGEMSAKSLRGSNMQDVIFSGTEKRKPLNYAEVSLVLDNSDHIFPVDYDEVMVTRRVFRSGETAYQINRVNCRLKDIHEIFMDTGLGRDGYSIIGQGNVAQILSTKAEDRRNLFEEAAGVSKYKYKKEEAVRKLKATEENLVRIKDITAELETQLGPLRSQSEKARKYLVLYDEFKDLDINLSMISLDKNSEESAKAEEIYKNVSDELAGMREQESETEAEISRLYEKSTQKDNELRDKNANNIENSSKIMTLKNEIAISENDIKNNKSAVERLDSEISKIQAENESKRARIGEIRNEKLGLISKLAELEAEFEKIKSGDSDFAKEQMQAENELLFIRRSVSEKENSIAAGREKISGIDALRETFLSRRNDIENEIENFTEDIKNIKTQIEENEKAIAEKRAKLERLSEIVSKSESELQKYTDEGIRLTEEINSLKVEYNSKSSRYKMYSDMENEYDGYARSVKAVLRAEELRRCSIYGTVAGLIDVKKEYAVAIETALGGAMQNIIVETEEDAKAAISYLKREHVGRATFLPVSSVKGRRLDNVSEVSKEPGYIGIGSDLISFNSKYDGIMNSLLGRVVIVDNIDSGIAISRKYGYKFKTVTLEGDVLNSGGAMSGGSANKTSGFLSRAAEIKTLKSELGVLKTALEKKTEEYKKNEENVSSVKARIEAYMPNLREYENEIIRLENSVIHLKKSAEGGDDTKGAYQSELSRINEQLEATSDDTVRILSEIRKYESEKKELEVQIGETEERIEKLKKLREDGSGAIMEYTLNISGLKRDITDADNSVSMLEKEIELGEEQIKSKENDKLYTEEKTESLEKCIVSKHESIKELEELSEEIARQIKAIEQQKEAIVRSLKEFQSSNKALTDKLLQLQQELSRAEARLAKLENDKENILNRLWDDYELSYSDALEIRKPVEDEKESQKRLLELKSKIKALGSVNMDSIEEYKSVSERFEFLSEQRDDLEKSEENLNKIIKSMEELMEHHFEEQFTQINESFGIVFKELFGGGRGRLYLQDPDNILESGIEIEVQLPGKGLQNINLYSGGERSFIAIALLFAILRVKPAPFCILDEIDAALDDVNVSRFATYLKNYLEQSQFIVITHRRGTMEAANIMYGVTMQEKGVSKLLSLHIDDIEEYGT